MAGGNKSNSLKSKKRAAQVKANDIQKALEKKARFRNWASQPKRHIESWPQPWAHCSQCEQLPGPFLALHWKIGPPHCWSVHC